MHNVSWAAKKTVHKSMGEMGGEGVCFIFLNFFIDLQIQFKKNQNIIFFAAPSSNDQKKPSFFCFWPI